MAYRPHPTKGPGWWIITISQGTKAKQLTFTHYGDEASVIYAEKQKKELLSVTKQIKATCTVAEKLPEYANHYRTIASPRIVTDMLSVFRRCLLPNFGKLQPKQISPPLVSQYTLQRLEEGVTHRTIQKELNYLSAMVKWLHRSGYTTEINPILKPPAAKCRPQRIQQGPVNNFV